jgi:hypothetical protein
MSKFSKGQKISIWLGILAFSGVIIAALINHSHGQPAQTVPQSISNGNNNIQAGGNVNTYNVSGGNNQIGNSNTMIIGDGMAQDTKQAIRSLFQTMNPILLTQIDAGRSELHIMVGRMSLMKLEQLSERSDFNKFLSFKETSLIVMAGSHNHIDDFLNEVNEDESQQTGIILFPMDALQNH